MRQTPIKLKIENHELLHKAIESLGWSYSNTRNGLIVNTRRGQLTIVGDSVTMDRGQERLFEELQQELKQEYGRETVRTAARVNGWNLGRFGFNSEGEIEVEISRESV